MRARVKVTSVACLDCGRHPSARAPLHNQASFCWSPCPKSRAWRKCSGCCNLSCFCFLSPVVGADILLCWGCLKTSLQLLVEPCPAPILMYSSWAPRSEGTSQGQSYATLSCFLLLSLTPVISLGILKHRPPSTGSSGFVVPGGSLICKTVKLVRIKLEWLVKLKQKRRK